MSKRKNQNSTELTQASKKTAHEQDKSSVSSPEEKMFHYHQERIDVSSLYLATKLADVHFVFDSSDGTETMTRIPAHRNLLAVTSDAFEKMFCGGLKENGDIKIVDASEAAFKEFLQFFYLNDVKLSAKHVCSVLYLGNKYNVEKCIDACAKFLTDDLSIENVCAALSLAVFCDQEELAKACEKHIILNTADIFKSAGFLESSKEALAHILKMNLLSCSEVDVFEACMEWVRAKSKQPLLSKATVEKYLGELYYQIRFASMTPQEFFTLETKYHAVLGSDFKDIIRLIEKADTHSEHFNTSPRQVEWNRDKYAIVKCDREFGECDASWHALDIEEKITFSSSVPLLLGKFECSNIRVGEIDRKYLRSDLTVEVEIIEARTLDSTDDVKILCSMTANLDSFGSTVSLAHPILIRPNFFYTIHVNGFSEGHYFSSLDQASSITLESSDEKIKIKFHNDNIVDGKIVGPIWLLIFNQI